jgi:hypothetical protein
MGFEALGICDSLGINSIAIQSISWSSLAQRALICANEFVMADEVFALSPISARAALPSEQDYDAIREAFMETSRGRWFLGEYAKRNRNADTTMVLDAVSRIEQAMAAQKQEPEPASNNLLIEALAAIRGAVDEAAARASTALTGLELTEKLAPIHKGARIIKEISWRWREIGADGRICDLIDSQLTAIEASCTQISETDGSASLSAAFDLLRHRLDELADGKEAAVKFNGTATAKTNVAPDGTAAAEAAVPPAAAPMPPEPAAKQRPEAEARTETAFAEPKPPTEAAAPEPIIVESEAEPVEAAGAIEVEPEAMSVQGVDAQDLARNGFAHDLADDHAQEDLAHDDLAHDDLAHDEAVLEMVAIEMAATDDPIDDFLPEEVAEVHAMPPPVVEPVAARAPEPAPAPRLQVTPPPPQRLEVVLPPPPPQFLPERAPSVAPEPSLGSTLIASGILSRPKPPSDPLAPIRRLSQAEKIAFFS